MSDMESLMVCFCCGRELEVTECGTPYPAVICRTSGNFGSTVYDPGPEFTGSDDHIIFYVCDWCLVERQGRVVVIGFSPRSNLPQAVPDYVRRARMAEYEGRKR